MPKLILQVNVSLNGYMCRPDGALDFMVHWDDELNAYVKDLTDSVNHILLARKLAEGFIPHWHPNPPREEQTTIDRFNSMRKTVFTTKMAESPWDETTQLATGELVEEVQKSKEGDGDGKDLIVYGGCTLVQNLLAGGLVDEMHLIVHPVSLKEGRSVFASESKFEVMEARTFGCGVVVLHYRKSG